MTQLLAINSENRINDFEIHLHAVVDWILRAQLVNNDGGIAASYKLIPGKWTSSYPETTGYTIPTLINYANRFRRQDILGAVERMAQYELAVQFKEGGFPGYQNKSKNTAHPVAFDTGQIIIGLLAAYDVFSEPRYLISAIRAADWLVSQQTPDGYWSDYHGKDSLQAIDTRVSWPLLCVYQRTGDQRYQSSAALQLDWALRQQLPNGWFQHCSFNQVSAPVTHTLAYTIEGLLESGLILGDNRYLFAAKKAADELLRFVQPTGNIPGAFDQYWTPAVSWNCLTGSAQMSRIWLRLGEITKNPEYLEIAERVLQFIAKTQKLSHFLSGVNGGIAGSWPIYGAYMRLKYPNWAANFFADAVLKITE